MQAQRSTQPPSALEAGLSHQSDKQALVDWVFSRVANRYDLGNDIMSAGFHTRWKKRLVAYADLKPGMRVLDIACGTGDVTWMVAAEVPGGEVIGTDINPDMMRPAAAKRPAICDAEVRFVQADAGRLPLEDASFDRITCGYAGRGFPDWPAVLGESFRVLKPGGHFWNLDFARPPLSWWDAVYRGYMTVSGAMLGTVLHGDPRTYIYIPASMKHYPGQRWLEEQMREVGFETELIETMACLMAYNHGIRPA